MIFFSSTGFSQTYKVIGIIDAETIKLSNGEIVHYIGVNTPKLHNGQAPEPYSQEAYFANLKLVEKKYVSNNVRNLLLTNTGDSF